MSSIMTEIPAPSPVTTPSLSHKRIRQNVKKLSTTSSTAWKNALKQSCIERARRNRRKRVLASRKNNSTTNGELVVGRGERGNDNSHEVAARQLVQQELRDSGIAIFSPGMDNNNYNNNDDSSSCLLPVTPQHSISPPHATQLSYSPETMMEEDSKITNHKQSQHEGLLLSDAEHDDYVLSELEYYELMQEVEDELQREEALLTEEMEEFERYDQQQFEEQIADFEQWEDAHHVHHLAEEMHQDECIGEGYGASTEVICPVCFSANLVEVSKDSIQCPNKTENCTVEISCVPKTTDGISSLQTLRERLRIIHDEHGALCMGSLRFSTRRKGVSTSRNALIAECETCHYHVDVLPP
mmetsp:Transcript_21331/g.32873  ORF Transcript_21331/g.32873 Transcript_21331/m.32873 type:complete len:355 (-) Transcript_21331:1609-2673(-)